MVMRPGLADRVDQAAGEDKLARIQAEKAVEAVLAALQDALLRGTPIELRGFGLLRVKRKKRGIGRTPKASQVVAGRTIRFHPGVVFPIKSRLRRLGRAEAVLALVDEDSLSLQILGKQEKAAVKAQFGRTSTGLTPAEEEALKTGGVGEVELAMGPALWAIARQASADKYERLVEDSLTVKETAARLRVTTGRIRQLLGSSRLFGFKVGGEWRIPSFQFLKRGGLVPGIDRVIRRLPENVGLLPFYNWLTTPNPDLRTRAAEEEALSPLDWLRTGESPDQATALVDAL